MNSRFASSMSLLRARGARVGCCTLVLLLSGCSDWLGLKGLRFDRGESEPPSETGGVSGLDGIPIGSGEVPEPSLFPMKVGENRQIVVSTAHGVSFGVYDPTTGELVQHRLSGPLERLEDVVVTSQWTQGLSHVVEVGVGERRALLGYDRTTGWVEIVERAIEEGEDVVGVTSSGSPGWTDLIAFELEGATKLLCYSADSGQFRLGTYDAADPDLAPPYLGQLPEGFTRLVVLDSDSPLTETSVRILAVNGATREIELYERQADDGLSLVARGASSEVGFKPMELLFTSFSKAGVPHVVEYEPATGQVRSASLSLPSEGALRFVPTDASTWPAGVTQMEPVIVDGKPVALIYNAKTGTLDLFGLDPLEATRPPVVR